MCNSCKKGLERNKMLANMMAKTDGVIYAVIKYTSGNYNFMTKEFAIENNMNIIYETV